MVISVKDRENGEIKVLNNTVVAYNSHADQYAVEADHRGVRVKDIDLIFSYLKGIENPKIVELGCAHGRDAEEIVKRTNSYVGMDASEELIKKARKKLPGYRFEVSSFEEFEFPEQSDAVIAFASLLHADKEVLGKVLQKVEDSLRTGGVFYISMQKGDYREITKEDELGIRKFYYYLPEDINQLAPVGLKQVFLEEYELREKVWFNLVLKKE